jgi:hypothetical protein
VFLKWFDRLNPGIFGILSLGNPATVAVDIL